MPSLSVQVLEQVMVPMRDGAQLAAEIYLPASTEGPWPTLLIGTPYDLDPLSGSHWAAHQICASGYAVVNQHVRGQYNYQRGRGIDIDGDDSFDTIAWSATQPWCNGRVGIWGNSYTTWPRSAAARRRPPGPICLLAASLDYYWGQVSEWGDESNTRQIDCQSCFLRLGAEDHQLFNHPRASTQLQSAFDSTTDLHAGRDHPHSMAHPIVDSLVGLPTSAQVFPLPRAPKPKLEPVTANAENVEIPSFLVAGWFDVFLTEILANYQALVSNAKSAREARTHRLIIGPWGHGLHSDLRDTTATDADSSLDVIDLQQRWFDHWLGKTDSDFDLEPPVRYYTMGANTWRSCCKWPPGGIEFVPYYLHGPGDREAHQAKEHGRLSRQPPSLDPPQRRSYNPRNPIPGEARDDVLSFTSEPLTESLEITGPVRAVLYAASPAIPTDFTTTLIDIQPHGGMLTICAGIACSRCRRDTLHASPQLQPGGVYRFDIDLLATSYVLYPGHLLRVDISSKQLGQFDRDASTGRPVDTNKMNDLQVAHQTIYHDGVRSSHLLLPVIPP